ncbi:MAG: hypothetical protein P8P88_08940 [Polaribacter sp.]|jgi:hypothetical protein|nr:hypothetical protein [Polaribacter sp.]
MKSTYANTSERGILTSTYKQEIRENISRFKSTSVSGMKSMILLHQNKMQSQAGTILRVSFFMFAIIFMVF